MTLRPRLRAVLVTALVFGGAAAITVYVNKLSELDPFASMRGRTGPLSTIDIAFKNVDMKHWQGNKLVTSGHFGQVDIHRDRQIYELYDVTDGVYRTSDATFHYNSGHALWYTAAQRLEADRGVRVRGKDFDLTAPNFRYVAPTHTVEVPGPATGTLGGGQASVVDVKYDIADGSYTTGAIDWHGKLAINFQDPDKSGPPSQGGKSDDNSEREWLIDGKHSHHLSGGLMEYTDVVATDKVSVVRSPNGTYDQKKDILHCKGPVKYWGEKANLICDDLMIYRKEKRAVATGNVVIYLKPEDKQVLDDKMEVPPFRPVVPDDISKTRPPAPILSEEKTKDANEQLRSSDNIKKYPTTIRADRIEYWYKKGERHAICTGSPQAQQEFPEGRWRMAWTHEADYDGEKELLKLISTPGQRDSRMKNSIGDDAVATWFLVSTKDGDDTYEAENEHIHTISFDQEANEAAAKAGKDKKKPDTGKTPPTKNPPPPLNGPIGH